MEGSSRIIDPYRLDVLTEAERRELQEEESGELLMDNGKWHLECLREKGLPVQSLRPLTIWRFTCGGVLNTI